LHRESWTVELVHHLRQETMENGGGGRRAESFILGTGVVTQTGAGAMWRDGHSVPWFPFESTD